MPANRSRDADLLSYMHRFAQRLLRVRAAQGWSQTRLAQELGLCSQTIANLEHELTCPRRTTVLRLMALEKRLKDEARGA